MTEQATTDLVKRLRIRPLSVLVDPTSMCSEAAATITAQQAEIERLREALTPSGSTKAAYIGEFHFDITRFDEAGEECAEKVYVPWTTIKEIMAAIYARAALKETGQ